MMGGMADRPPPRPTIDDVLAVARAGIRRLPPAEAWAAACERGALLVDTRDAAHVAAEGALPGALRLPLSVLPWRADPASPWRDERLAEAGLDAELILVCRHGFSSSLAAALLAHIGWTQVGDVEGGVEAWAAAGLPLLRPPT